MPTIDGRVQLEGGDEAYNTWEEVEQFMLPETLLSMEDSDSDDYDYQEDLESSFNALDISDGTSMSSTHSMEQSPKSTHASPAATKTEDSQAQHKSTLALAIESPNRTARNSTEFMRADKSPKGSIPPSLRPLFNHILWRIHKESNPDAALENFILLTNDPTKQTIAQKFGIRAKRLEQLRDAVLREDREFKNHLAMHKKECEARATTHLEPKSVERPKSSHSALSKPVIDSDEEDEVLLKRAPRGPANTTNSQRVFDPNDFGRTTHHHSPRGGRGSFVSRGRGGPHRGGRGGFTPRGAYVPPGPSFRSASAPRHDPNQPIDPDSFTRPSLRGSVVRGTRRQLWEPN